MAEAGRRRPESRDLVPYAAEGRDVVLRHKNKVVIYDHQSHQLTLLDAKECPYCHRPYDSSTELDSDDDDVVVGDQERAPFASSRYFQLLAASIAGSPSTSREVSPSKRYPPLPPVRNLSEQPSQPAIAHHSEPDHTSRPTRISTGAFSQGYFRRFFTIERELGRGGKGTVLLVKHVLDGVDLGSFACKRIPVGNDHTWLEKALMEVSLVQNMSHENLVSYRHVWLEDFKPATFGPSTPHVFILQQFCDSGTLFDYVLGPRSTPQMDSERLRDRARRLSSNARPHSRFATARPLSFEEIFAFFKDTASGLAYLHSHGFVHRDLKPQNCLLHRAEHGLRVLLSDFGEMQFANTPRQPAATGFTGTVSFSAPEVLMPDPSGKLGDFTAKSDVFSLGMVVYFMSFGRLPYSNADIEEDKEDLERLKAEIIAWRGMQNERRARADLPEKLYGFLNLLLSPNPADRPSTEAILLAIRAESLSSDLGGPSPHRERFESPEKFHEPPQEPRAPLPSPDLPGVRRRSIRSDRNRQSRSFSRDEVRQRFQNSVDARSPSSPLSITEQPSDAIDVAVVQSNSHAHASVFAEEPVPVTEDMMESPKLLLAPPPRSRSVSMRLVSQLRSMSFIDFARFMMFVGKIWTVQDACVSSSTTRPFVLLLSALAALDLILRPGWPALTAALFVVHVAILLGSLRAGVLCDERQYWNK